MNDSKSWSTLMYAVPNTFAIVALFSWPLISFIFYRLFNVVSATLLTFLVAELLLPYGTFFKFEMIPQFDKYSIPTFCALLGCMIVAKRRPQLLGRHFGIPEALIVCYLLSPVATAVLNSDPIQVGSTTLPGTGIYDGLSALLGQLITLAPFLLGRQYLRNPKDLLQTLKIMGFAGLIYSVPMLFEIRFSPQLHFWVYGYQPTDFIQEVREGGAFRPMVFMGHGLTACFFLMTTVVASAALWRMKVRLLGVNSSLSLTYLGGVLVLCKSGAALVYGLVLVPIVRWGRPSLLLRAATCFAALALLYPALRTLNVFPTQTILDVARAINEPRAASLELRFTQEQELLQRASERPLFGWGRFGRSRVYKIDWRNIGYDTSTTDGRWVITLGAYGLMGFMAEFGLLAVPIFRALSALKRIKSHQEATCLGAMSLILAINMVDLLPNSTLLPWSWLIAGALLGCSETVLARRVGARRQTQNLQFDGDLANSLTPCMSTVPRSLEVRADRLK